MSKAFIVLGPEGSGTRWVTSLFIAAGCYGDATHEQRLDEQLALPNEDLFVWRRSLPHDGKMPNTYNMVTYLKNHAVENIEFIACVRDWFSIANSQVREHYAANFTEAYAKTMFAYNFIYSNCSPWQFNYEAAVLYGLDYINNFMRNFDLQINSRNSIEIVDGNLKYYRKPYVP